MTTPIRYVLSSIRARGFKGGDFEIQFTDLAAVLVGDNAKGKTAILEAIQFGLLGYVPRYGRDARAAFLEISSGTELVVELFLAQGTLGGPQVGVCRRLYAKGNSVKKEESVPGFLANAEGDPNPLLSVMVDPAVFFDLGSTDKIRWLFENTPLPEGFSPEAVLSRVAAAAPRWRIAPRGDAEPLDAYIDRLLAQSRGDYKSAADHAERMQETIRGLSGRRADEDAPEARLSELANRRAALETAIASANEAKGRAVAGADASSRASSRRGAIARELLGEDKDRARALDLRAKRGLVIAELTAAPDVSEEEIRELAEAESKALVVLTRVDSDAKKTRDERLGRESKLSLLDGQTECPYCGATGEAWKSIKAAELAREIADLEGLQSTLDSALGSAREGLEAARKLHKDRSFSRWRRAQLQTTLAGVDRELAPLDGRISNYASLAAERDALPLPDAAAVAAVDEAQQRVNVLNQEMRSLNAEIDRASGRKQELLRFAQFERDRDKALEEKTEAEGAGRTLKAIKSEIVAGAIRPLLESANRLIADVFGAARDKGFEIAYDPEKAQIGTHSGGHWRSHLSFSGMERALVFAAVQAALTSASPVRLMLIDELGNLRRDKAARLASAIRNAIERGAVDQFIGIDPERPEPYEKEAFQIVPVE